MQLPYMGFTLVPLLTAAMTLKYFRSKLHLIWDVSLIIRKTSDTSKEQVSIFEALSDYIFYDLLNF
jgi:hypothetical protein